MAWQHISPAVTVKRSIAVDRTHDDMLSNDSEDEDSDTDW